ncbi:MAG: phasin family protein [Hyphomicrobiaceae bacterium]
MTAPESTEEMMEDRIAKSKETLGSASDAARKASNGFEKTVDASRDNASEIGQKILKSIEANTAAGLQFASDLASAKSPQQAASIQLGYWQSQSKEWMQQSVEICEMSREATAAMMASFGDIAAKTNDQAKAD